MKKIPVFLTSLSLLALVGGVANAQGVNKWKYVPQTVKTPKIPAVLNPKLPLQTKLNWARLDPVISSAVTRQTAPVLQAPAQPVYPQRFTSFVSWLNKIKDKRLVAPTLSSQYAINALQEGILHYDQLSPNQQAQLNFWVITLDRLRLKLGSSKTNTFYRLFYHGKENPGQLPQLANMHLQAKKTGMAFSQMSQILDMGLKTLYLAEDHRNRNFVKGFTFISLATPQKAQTEFARAIKAVLPDEYRIRMSVHELGIEHGNRDRFRKGYLHLHFEKIAARTEILPVDESIELWLSCKSFTGVVDPTTRKVIVPFDDKQIAQNYLTVFGDYLSRDAKQTLHYIIYGKDTLEKLPIEPDESSNEN